MYEGSLRLISGRLTWNAQATVFEYNVYRSEAIDLESLVCYQVTPVNMLDDVGEIPVGGLPLSADLFA